MWLLGGLAGLIALLFFGIAILGHLGIFADVSYHENRQMGQQAFWIGLVASGPSIVLMLIAGLLHRHESAK